MQNWRTLADIRRDYGNLGLSEADALSCPFAQFKAWFAEVLREEKNDPTAMVLSTVDEDGCPDSRVVLLKDLTQDRFVFYTNYQSSKARQLNYTPMAALNFYWPQMARQVRIRGRVQLLSSTESDAYFATRPLSSQLSAIVSPQSREIASRMVLEEALHDLIERYQHELVVRPENWGGYAVVPQEFEFWQGRDNRLHDRIHYYQQNGVWQHRRLAP